MLDNLTRSKSKTVGTVDASAVGLSAAVATSRQATNSLSDALVEQYRDALAAAERRWSSELREAEHRWGTKFADLRRELTSGPSDGAGEPHKQRRLCDLLDDPSDAPMASEYIRKGTAVAADRAPTIHDFAGMTSQIQDHTAETSPAGFTPRSLPLPPPLTNVSKSTLPLPPPLPLDNVPVKTSTDANDMSSGSLSSDALSQLLYCRKCHSVFRAAIGGSTPPACCAGGHPPFLYTTRLPTNRGSYLQTVPRTSSVQIRRDGGTSCSPITASEVSMAPSTAGDQRSSPQTETHKMRDHPGILAAAAACKQGDGSAAACKQGDGSDAMETIDYAASRALADAPPKGKGQGGAVKGKAGSKGPAAVLAQPRSPGRQPTPVRAPAEEVQREPTAQDVADQGSTDGLSSALEAQLREIFNRVDRDHDGGINRRELILTLRRNPDICEHLKLPDKIRQEDGSRDKVEAFFQSIDADSDNLLTVDELLRHFAANQASNKNASADSSIWTQGAVDQTAAGAPPKDQGKRGTLKGKGSTNEKLDAMPDDPPPPGLSKVQQIAWQKRRRERNDDESLGPPPEPPALPPPAGPLEDA
eukprot:SAG31_NODE_235_length_19695_cov_37.959790_16_plen_587_part_00